MPAKNFMLSQPIEPKRAYEYLKDNLRSPKVSSITYDEAMQRVNIEANYYIYQVSFIGNQMSINLKTVQKWMIIMLICAGLGLFLFVPLIGVVIICVIMASEFKEVSTLIHQTMNMIPKPE